MFTNTVKLVNNKPNEIITRHNLMYLILSTQMKCTSIVNSFYITLEPCNIGKWIIMDTFDLSKIKEVLRYRCKIYIERLKPRIHHDTY